MTTEFFRHVQSCQLCKDAEPDVCEAALGMMMTPTPPAPSNAVREENMTTPPMVGANNQEQHMQQKPSVGRMVHYQAYGSPNGEHKSLPRAAIITEVEDDGETVGLCVLNPTGQYFNRGTKFSHEPKPGHWNWPPRV